MALEATVCVTVPQACADTANCANAIATIAHMAARARFRRFMVAKYADSSSQSLLRERKLR